MVPPWVAGLNVGVDDGGQPNTVVVYIMNFSS
jgi:hypothetical protein